MGPDVATIPAARFHGGGPGGRIRLTMLPNVGGAVRYELRDGHGSYPFEMQAGQQQKLDEDRVWGIRFHRGLGEEFASYRLIEGEYGFGIGPRGWELFLVRAGSGLPPAPPWMTSASPPAMPGPGTVESPVPIVPPAPVAPEGPAGAPEAPPGLVP